MSTYQSILDSLTGRGFRLTLARRAIIEYFVEVDSPVDVEQLVQYLTERTLHPNKTTLYRELAFLLEHNVIQEFDFGEGKKRYELAEHGHHHHLICTECKAVEGIEIKEEDLASQEHAFLAEKGFEVSRHMLEFFGTCKRCRAHNHKLTS